ncbi:hypothetical protein [Ornatilinea apprima]|nr:hypothetical protein [Ornatilinea apprima]
MSRKSISVVSVILFVLVVLLLFPVGETQASPVPTRTPKACHMCEEFDYLATETPIPECDTYCAEDNEVSMLPQNDSASKNQAEEQGKAILYLFWGDGCPHCEVAKPFLSELDQSSDLIETRFYEVWNDKANQVKFTEMANAFGFQPQGVPTIFLGTQYWVGFNDQIEAEIKNSVDLCLETGCPDAGVGIFSDVSSGEGQGSQGVQEETLAKKSGESIKIPLIGSVDLSKQSLFVSTLLISFVDGFNPCSVWVLTMLLALTLHTGSRKKVFVIGVVFLTVTAAIYGMFIAGLFTMFTVVSFVTWIQVVVALVALFFALVNIKDYFFYQEGISFTIADKNKPGIFQRIRKLMDNSQSVWGLISGTVVLAAGISLVEFSCTAGFPVLWTNLLVAQNTSIITFLLLLLVYLIIYQLDEMAIFFVAVYTMRASKLEEKHGRILKLIGGVLMFALAVVMLVNPDVMNDLTDSMVVFGIAFGAAILILIVHRWLLPRFGIQFALEPKKDRTRKKNRRSH